MSRLEIEVLRRDLAGLLAEVRDNRQLADDNSTAISKELATHFASIKALIDELRASLPCTGEGVCRGA